MSVCLSASSCYKSHRRKCAWSTAQFPVPPDHIGCGRYYCVGDCKIGARIASVGTSRLVFRLCMSLSGRSSVVAALQLARTVAHHSSFSSLSLPFPSSTLPLRQSSLLSRSRFAFPILLLRLPGTARTFVTNADRVYTVLTYSARGPIGNDPLWQPGKLLQITALDRVTQRLTKHDLRASFDMSARDFFVLDSASPLYPTLTVSASGKALLASIDGIKAMITTEKLVVIFPPNYASHQAAHVQHIVEGNFHALCWDVTPESLESRPHAFTHLTTSESIARSTLLPPSSLLSEPNLEKLKQRALEIEGQYEDWELLALDVVLESVCSKMQQRKQLLSPVVSNVVQILSCPGMDAESSSRELRLLLPIKSAVASFAEELSAVQSCLKELITSERDMAEFRISLRHGQKKDAEKPHVSFFEDEEVVAARTRSIDLVHHTAVERILDKVYGRVSDLQHDTEKLKRAVVAGIEYNSINLSSARNQLLRMNFHLQAITVGIASGATIASAFGMNLPIPAFLSQEIQGVFFGTCGVIVTISVGVYFLLYAGVFKTWQRGLSKPVEDVRAVEQVLNNLDEIAHILQVKVAGTDGSDSNDGLVGGEGGVSKKEFRAFWQEMTGVPVGQAQVDLIFRVLDANTDNRLMQMDLKHVEEETREGLLRPGR